LPVTPDGENSLADLANFFTPAMELFASWPWMLAGVGADTMTIARQSIYFGGKAQFGDGKPIILVPDYSSNLPFVMLSNWLKAVGYRPVTMGLSVNVDDPSVIRAITQRVGRKAVLVTPGSGMQRASLMAEAQKDRLSDIVVLNASQHPDTLPGIRSHFISSGWSLPVAMAKLPQVLRDIRIELVDESSSVGAPRSMDAIVDCPQKEN
jgi:hypothetical protein